MWKKALLVSAASAVALASGVAFCKNAKKTRTPWAFGSNAFGQLGIGTEKDEPLPIPIPSLLECEKLVTGPCSESSAAISAGKLYTFGCGNDSRLGHATKGAHPNQTTPRQVLGLDSKVVTQAAVGEFHMAAVTEDGKVFTFGKARAGLGHDNAIVGGPNEVKFDKQVAKVALGRTHCVFLTKDGEVYTFGSSGREGALGHGDTAPVKSPKKVEGLEDIVDVSCGKDFTLVLDSSGNVYSFGMDNFGELGCGSVERYQRKPTLLRSLEGEEIVQISAGQHHCFAVSKTDTVFSWGNGKDGQLGHDSREHLSIPSAVESLKGEKIAKIACGGGHTAVIKEDGSLLMIGRGRNGQLGRHSLESKAGYLLTPRLVEEMVGLKCVDVSLGSDHTLVITEEEEEEQ